jgi:K+-transporting ATPase A subunit
MRSSRFKGAGIGIALLVGAVALMLLVKGLYPADLPSGRNPDFVDTIFDNRGVVWAARLLLVSAAAVLAFGGIFIVLSIGIRIKNGEWLRRAVRSRSRRGH